MRVVSGQRAGRYPFALRVLHWVLACLLVVQLGLGYAAEHWTTRATSDALLAMHFRLGALVLALTLLRLALRLALAVPPAEERMSRWRRCVRGTVHGLLYALVMGLPASGYVVWVWMDADRTLFAGLEMPALFTPPGDETGRALAWYAHVYGAWLLSALVAVHVAAAWRQSRRTHASIASRMGFGRGDGVSFTSAENGNSNRFRASPE